ncbi:hypothetical protein ACTJI8_02845 [Microbacterium sp. 22303]|uniref:hypothetical protein n=1 Tax=Microbacterium sp. 22303 TaxID=3453905 RepID=UPI003F86BC73
MTGIQVTVCRPQRGSAGQVLVQVEEAVTVALTSDEARDLGRGILSAAIELERAERAKGREARHRAAVKELRRPSRVDEELRERDA